MTTLHTKSLKRDCVKKIEIFGATPENKLIRINYQALIPPEYP